MDALEREESYSRRPSIKRPWEEDALSPETIDPVPYRRPSKLREAGPTSNLHTLYQPDNREFGAKRARYEGNNDYYSFPDGKLHSQASQIYNPNQRSLDSPSFREVWEGGEPADAESTAILCRRCRRLTKKHQDLDLYESCEECRRNPELALVTQKAAAALTQLAETISSGVSSGQRGIILTPEQFQVSSSDCPPIEQYGLRHTLKWLLGRINHINGLADKLVQNVPSGSSPFFDRKFTWHGQSTKNGPTGIMKRHIDTDTDEAQALRDSGENTEPLSDAKLYTRRRSITTATSVAEELPSRSQHDYHYNSQTSLDVPSRRDSIMNPPPVPNRQLPSPPGRSLPSPTSLNFLSPSAGLYGSISQPLNLPPPSNLHQSSPGAYLPAIGGANSADAIQAHSAALQHEVSLQKIALSSLQSEHDKLLAAFSRSQTRASALEKKHAVSDSEIISLSEEKIRLQAQVMELEHDVEELSRTRDEFRQVAVQEGAQYVEIVKKASQLEELAAEERKNWSKMRAEMEQTIEALRAGASTSSVVVQTAAILPITRIIDDIDTPVSPVEAQSELKIEPPADHSPESYPKEFLTDSNDMLKQEIRRLRSRCAEVEAALRAVRNESQNMEGIVEALGLAGKSILERAERALGKVTDDGERVS